MTLKFKKDGELAVLDRPPYLFELTDNSTIHGKIPDRETIRIL